MLVLLRLGRLCALATSSLPIALHTLFFRSQGSSSFQNGSRKRCYCKADLAPAPHPKRTAHHRLAARVHSAFVPRLHLPGKHRIQAVRPVTDKYKGLAGINLDGSLDKGLRGLLDLKSI